MYQMNGNAGMPFGGGQFQGGMGQYHPMGGGQMPMPAPMPRPFPGYGGFNPQPGGMPQPNPGMTYGGDFNGPTVDNMNRHMILFDPHYGGNPQPGGMDYLRHQFAGGMPGGNMGGATPWGRPMPNPGGMFPGSPYYQGLGGGMQYGGNPQPGGMPATNPGIGIPQRDFANGNPFYNAKGNLRMRYRPGGQGEWMNPGTPAQPTGY